MSSEPVTEVLKIPVTEEVKRAFYEVHHELAAKNKGRGRKWRLNETLDYLLLLYRQHKVTGF